MIATNNIDLDISYLPSQDEVFYQDDSQFKIVSKGRRAGFTRGSALYSIECLLDGESVLWIDTVQVNLDGYFQLYFLPILRQLPGHCWNYNQSKHNLVVNGTRLCMRSAERAENIEGFSYNKIILNEAGIILKGQRGRKLWYSSVLPMIMDYNSDVVFVGTPKGKKATKGEISETGSCLYYELSQKEMEEEPGWKTFNYSSYSNKTLSEKAIIKLETEIPHALKQQEIYGQFIDLGGQLIFKDHWFPIVTHVPQFHKRKIMSLDTAFKTKESSDYSAAVVFLETRSDYFWIDMFNEKLEFPQLIKKTIEFFNFHKPDILLIEDKASGQSLIQCLRQETRIPIKPIKVDSDKLSRTNAVTTYFETLRVKLLKGPWNREAINQLCAYNGIENDHDDIVDSVSQLLNYSKSSRIDYKPVSRPRARKLSPILNGY